MSAYTTKFGVGDSAYYIKHADIIQVIITDTYIHDTVASFCDPLISYRVNYPLNSSGVGSNCQGKTLFFEDTLLYLSEAQAEIAIILADKATDAQGLM